MEEILSTNSGCNELRRKRTTEISIDEYEASKNTINDLKEEREQLLTVIEEYNSKFLQFAQISSTELVFQSHAHDMRHTMHNINALISSLIFIARSSRRKNAVTESLISSLSEQTDYLATLFESLKSNRQKSHSRFREHCLVEIMKEVQQLFNTQLMRYKILVGYNLEISNDYKLMCNNNQLEQILLNLYSNSIAAIKKKSQPTGKIDISVFMEERQLVVVFRDNGIGICPEHIDKVFDPLFATNSERAGFGLTICKRIIEDNYSGKIYATSTKGEYTEIKFTICIS